jgi:hypothetical protein
VPSRPAGRDGRGPLGHVVHPIHLTAARHGRKPAVGPR